MRRALCIFSIVTLVACSRSTAADAQPKAVPSSATAATQTSQPASAPTPAPSAKPVAAQLPEVVARVNGEDIKKPELENAVRGLEGRVGAPVPPDQRDRVYREVLDELIGYRLLMQEAKGRKILIPEAEIDAQIAQIRGQFPNEEQFKQALTAQKTTLEAVREDARAGLGVEKLLDAEVGQKVAVTPAQVTAFYPANQEKFQQGARVRASHILITVPQNADAAARQQAKTKAETVLKEVKAGKDFAVLARANSQDPGSGPNGGDLGFFEQGQMVPPFEAAAFALKAGETSDLVETQFGYHIIKVAEKQAPRTVPLDEAKQQIEEYLVGQSRETQTKAFVEALRSKAKIDILM